MEHKGYFSKVCSCKLVIVLIVLADLGCGGHGEGGNTFSKGNLCPALLLGR